MSHSLPPEILDLIVDHLHDEPATLETCCLTCKSWIHRTRKHLFANIEFRPPGPNIESWAETFPDPTNSPAHYTRTLSIHHPHLIESVYADTISSFCSVVRLDVITGQRGDERVTLVSLHRFSPVLRSLRLTFVALPDSEIFDLICSFPLLEDLEFFPMGLGQRDGQWTTPLTSPRLTGFLDLGLGMEGIQPITRRLLDLPNGLRFTTIVVSWLSIQDVISTTDLVSRCSDTVQSLEVTSYLSGMFPVVSVSEFSFTTTRRCV